MQNIFSGPRPFSRLTLLMRSAVAFVSGETTMPSSASDVEAAPIGSPISATSNGLPYLERKCSRSAFLSS